MLPVVPSADVNWLLSTEVQSGAALVAIVGGLLVARLTGLSGERAFLNRAISDTEAELAMARTRAEDAQAAVENLNAGGFLNYGDSQIMEKSGVLTDGELAELIDASGWPVTDRSMADTVRPWISRVRGAFERAAGYLGSLGNAGVINLAELNDAIGDGVPGIDSDTTNLIIDELARRGDLGDGQRQARGIRLMAINPQVSATDRQTRERRIDDAGNRYASFRDLAATAEARLHTLEGSRAQAARPEGLGKVLAALAYLAVACLIVPLVLMAWGRTSLPAWTRALIVALFISGVIVFVAVLIDLLRGSPAAHKGAGHDDADGVT